MSSLVQELEEIARLQEIVKRQSMIYQYEAKCIVAEHYGLPFDQVDLPFNEWMALWNKYRQSVNGGQDGLAS